MALKAGKIEMKDTNIKHIKLVDVDDSGLFRECAIVNEFPDGSIAYIIIDTLHPIDKARLKKVITGQHSDHYPLYELLSQARFSNGINGLDYMHQNFVKVKRPRGAAASTNSILSTGNYHDSGTMIGAEFVNPAEVNLDTATRQFK